MKKKQEKHPLVKMQEQVLKVGMNWFAKVTLRCALEGCRYGNEFIDKDPVDNCIYCGVPNPNINFWDISKFKKRKANL